MTTPKCATRKGQRVPSAPESSPAWKDENGTLHIGPSAPPVRHPNLAAALAGSYSSPLLRNVEEIEGDAARGYSSRVGGKLGGDSTRESNEELENQKQAAFEAVADEIRKRDRFIDRFDNPLAPHLFKARDFAGAVAREVTRKYPTHPEHHKKPETIYKRLKPYWSRYRKINRAHNS